MTAYVETERVAHVMEWREYGPAWRSLCTRGPKISPSEWDDAREWPMRYATADRTKPFCRLCVGRWNRPRSGKCSNEQHYTGADEQLAMMPELPWRSSIWPMTQGSDSGPRSVWPEITTADTPVIDGS